MEIDENENINYNQIRIIAIPLKLRLYIDLHVRLSYYGISFRRLMTNLIKMLINKDPDFMICLDKILARNKNNLLSKKERKRIDELEEKFKRKFRLIPENNLDQFIPLNNKLPEDL